VLDSKRHIARPERDGQSQAANHKEPWWRKNPKTPVRNHSKRGLWTLPDLDNLRG
jgi:hypothetical protein